MGPKLSSLQSRFGFPAFRILSSLFTALACLSITPSLLAGTLTFNVLDPFRINQPGSIYTFQGQITNDTGTPLQATDLFLNFSGYNPTVIVPNQLLGFPDFTIPNNSTSAIVPLFNIDFASTADPQQTYIAAVTLQDFTSDFVSPSVTVVIAPVPEPCQLPLLVLLVPILFLLRRASRNKQIAGTLAILLVCASPVLHAQSGTALIDTGVTGQALIPPSTLELEIPLINDGDAAASDVTVTSVSLMGAPLQAPTSFPVLLGSLSPGQVVNLYASFDHSGLATGGRYLLTARGTYTLGSSLFGFTVHQFVTLLPANTLTGDTVARRATDSPTVSPASYPPDPFVPEIETANPAGPDIPIGPSRPGPVNGPVSVDESLVSNAGSAALSVVDLNNAAVDPAALTVFRNTAVRNDVTARFSTQVNDPSAATDGTLVLMTGNTYGLFSKDGGKTFTYIDPTTIFPNDATNKLCCDQVVIYAPQINRFIWLLQYDPVNSVNMIRLATATAADLAAKGPTAAGVWSYYEITSAVLGLGLRWMDFPGLALSDKHLLISANLIDDKNRDFKTVGSLLLRYELADLGGVVTRDWSVEMGFVTARGVQNSGDNGFWAAHGNTSEMELWREPEDSMRVYQRKVEIPSWPSTFGDFDSFTPAPRTNWLAYLRDLRSCGYAITGSTRADNILWFAWTAAKGSVLDNNSTSIQIPQPHIEAVGLKVGSYRLSNRIVLYSRNYAYAYPALSTNENGDVGISLAYGGNTAQPNHAVGFLTPNSVPLKKTTNSTSASPRWGDFMSIRPYPNSALFSAAGHGWTGSPDPHYVVFGHAGDGPP